MRIAPATLSLGTLLLFSAAAHADVIDPTEDACRDKSRGDACAADGKSGTCQPDRCCRLDYSNGTPPGEVCEDCLTCKPGGDDDGCVASPGTPGGAGAVAFLAGLALAIGLRRSRR
ncbi:MAG: MYXO-CTERM sorting domain-containing protein [bacterium]|nr:hypothetical protein [Myxococcales bacterium]